MLVVVDDDSSSIWYIRAPTYAHDRCQLSLELTLVLSAGRSHVETIPHNDGYIFFSRLCLHGRDAQPSWLRRNRSLQKRRRLLEVNYESCCAAVTAARERRDAREKQGLAYGDPVVAIERLVDRSRQAEDELRELETRRKAFLERQAEAEVSMNGF